MDFKYKTKFTSTARLDLGKWKEWQKVKASKQVFASLDDLRSLLPTDEEINDNSDLLYTSFNAAVVNLINANDHGIDTEMALEFSKYFKDRHMNLEHDRYEVVGHIISQGFSSYGENKIVTPESLIGTNQPFNICLGSVVYKVVREYIADFIEETADKDSCYHQMISASWEVGYNEYDIALGSKKLADAIRITDPEKINELKQYLKIEGGGGFLPDGTPCYCVIKGNARPLGCAFTNTPAADVSGVFVPEIKDDEEDASITRVNKGSEEETPEETPLINEELEAAKAELLKASEELETLKLELKASKNAENTNNLEIINKNSSQLKNNTVNKYMKLKSAQDITPEFLLTAEASVEVRQFITDELKKTSDDFAEKVKVALTEKETVEASLKETKATLDETNTSLAAIQDELKTLKDSVDAKAKQEAFDARMEEISASYELSEAQSTAVASQIKELDEPSFTSWKTNFELFTPKKVVASTEDKEASAAAALKTATASTTATVPNSQAPETNELEVLVKNLSKAITINKQ